MLKNLLQTIPENSNATHSSNFYAIVFDFFSITQYFPYPSIFFSEISLILIGNFMKGIFGKILVEF